MEQMKTLEDFKPYSIARSWWFNHKSTPISEEMKHDLKNVHHLNARPTNNKKLPRYLICYVMDKK